MRRILHILILFIFFALNSYSQSITINELIKLSNLSSKEIVPYLTKKGFMLKESTSDSMETRASFTEKFKFRKKSTEPSRCINIYFKDNAKCLTLQTPALNEYEEGKQKLIKAGFFYDTLKDITKERSILFQKANVTVQATAEMQDDSSMQYSFHLKEKAVPSSLRYAEELLQFDSHAFLVSYFGEQNVKKDMYYLTEKELKRCSVLFSGTPHQAVFVWDDDIYLNKLLYILVTNKLPTKGAAESNPLAGNNEWQLKNGIYPGMALKELLKINETDFDIYGNKSEMAFLIKPNEYGKINFKKIAVMLSCHECFDNKIFNQNTVSALEVAKANLSMRVFDVALYPSDR